MKKGEVTSKDIMEVMQRLCSRSLPGGEGRGMSMETVRRMGNHWGWLGERLTRTRGQTRIRRLRGGLCRASWICWTRECIRER